MSQILYKALLACSIVVTIVSAAFIVALLQIWPFTIAVRTYTFFAASAPGEEIGWRERLENDFGGRPWRKLVYRHHQTSDKLRPVSFSGLADGATPPKIYISPQAPRGYRLIVGAFQLKDGFDAAVLIDSTGSIRHWWRLIEDESVAVGAERNKFPHGFVALPDGSVIFTFDSGNSIRRVDACSQPIWTRVGVYHHAITIADDGSIWSLRENWAKTENWISNLDALTGEPIKELHLGTVMKKNPDKDIFTLRQADRFGKADWVGDFWHPNDVDPLPADLAQYYPDFEAGDLLVSMRAINLVFVVSPDTAEIKWWRIGSWRRQHDPDWGRDGRIMVYDNQMHRGVSRIVSIDPATYSLQTLVDGADYDFYSTIRGKQQRHSGDALLVTAPQQGRVFELNADGDIVFEFESSFSDEANFTVSEAIFLPEDYFEFQTFPNCGR